MEIEESNDFARAPTQPSSLKHLKHINTDDFSAENSPNRGPTKSTSFFSFEAPAPEPSLHDLLVDYFHKPMVEHLRNGHDATASPYACLLEAMHKTQRNIKDAISRGVEVNVRVPEPIYLTSDKPVLIIDLDETLIHSAMGRKFGDNVITIKSRKHGNVVFSVTVRPHAREFLQEMAKYYTLVLFTAAEQSYADECIKMLDPNHTLFALKLYKSNCLSIDRKFNIKDLRMFRNIPMHNILILDNNPLCYLLQPSNAIPVTSFYFDMNDIELRKLAAILKAVAPLENKQESLKDYFFKQCIEDALKYDELVSSILNASLHF